MTDLDDLRTKAAELCEHLRGWRVSSTTAPACVILEDTRGRQIALSTANDCKYLVISGHWPRDSLGRQHAPSDQRTLRTTFSRPAKAVARLIETRFLPHFFACYADAKRRIGEFEKQRGQLQAVADTIAGALGLRLPVDTSAYFDFCLLRYRGAEITVYATGDVTITFRGLTVRDAIHLLRRLEDVAAQPQGRPKGYVRVIPGSQPLRALT